MSSFRYSITRPYPHKWFTPVAVVGGIVLAALFSFINFYSNAYNMITITTNNPDIVEANQWSHIPGFLTSRIDPKCEDAIIPIGSTFNTNQTALSYQLSRLRNYPALSYHNRRLESCEATQISIDFQTSIDRQAALIDRSSWGVTVSADITCNAPNEEHEINYIGFRTHYDPLTWATQPGVSGFIRVNASSPGFVWANTLLLAFWTETVTATVDQTLQPNSSEIVPLFNLSSGYISFSRPGINIYNESFFRLGKYAFFNLPESKAYRGDFNITDDTLYEGLITKNTWPNIWSPANRLAKAMYSVIQVDLGQTDTVITTFNGTPADMNRLHHWTENLTQIWDRSTVADKNNLLPYGLMQMRQLDKNTDATNPRQPLRFTPSVISATYTCQVPRLKSHGNIFISILVADLVLLRAAWTLYNYLVDYFLKSRHPDANVCEKCLVRGQDDEVVTVASSRNIGKGGKEEGAEVEDVELDDLGMSRRSNGREGDGQSMQSLLPHRIVDI
ncbi:hypothetical protein D6C87_09577 [Aureobasidium pullulans]|nr:hypothetical protein D6C87_09577 [Aureobasidium pullulans]